MGFEATGRQRTVYVQRQEIEIILYTMVMFWILFVSRDNKIKSSSQSFQKFKVHDFLMVYLRNADRTF